MSIAKGQKRVMDGDLLNQLGQEDNVELVLNTVLARELHRYGKKLIKTLRKNLEEDNLVATGFLKSRVDYDVAELGNNLLKFKALAPDYWEDVNDGQPPGTFVEVKDLMDWIAAKPIPIRHSRSQSTRSVLSQAKGMAIAIQKTILKKGTIKRFNYGGSGFLSKEINDQSLTDLSLLLTELTGRTVALSIKNNFETT